jgi:hypothetical protein
MINLPVCNLEDLLRRQQIDSKRDSEREQARERERGKEREGGGEREGEGERARELLYRIEFLYRASVLGLGNQMLELLYCVNPNIFFIKILMP